MNKKVTAILSYCTIFGWLVAFIGGDKENAKFDLNQGLVIGLATVAAIVTGALVSLIPVAVIRLFFDLAVWAVEAACVICSVFGIVNSAKGEEKELPIVSKLQILK